MSMVRKKCQMTTNGKTEQGSNANKHTQKKKRKEMNNNQN